MKAIYEVQSYLTFLAGTKVKSFYIEDIEKKFSLNLNEALEIIAKLEKMEMVQLKYEIRHDCLQIVEITNDYRPYLNKTLSCDYCEEGRFLVDIGNVYPICYIKDEYKKYIQYEKKTKNQKRESLLLNLQPI